MTLEISFITEMPLTTVRESLKSLSLTRSVMITSYATPFSLSFW